MPTLPKEVAASRTWLLRLVVIALLAPASWTALGDHGDGKTAASVKAHLADGTVVLFADGLRIDREGRQVFVRGSGHSIAAAEVYALEFYDERLMGNALQRSAARKGSVRVDPLQSSASLYSFDGSDFVLEGEAFSTNILAAAEADDLDRLDAGVAIDGRYRLRLSNHAWETQYINALKLHAVDHAPGWEVLPTRKRELVRIGPTKALGRAISRDGREVSELLALRDEQQYRTASEVTRELTQSITYDWVDFEVQVPEGVREFFVALRVRNTLFSNVLLEDALLTGRGHQTIDLLGGERFRLLEMWRLRRWVNKQMGLRLLIHGRNGYRAVDRIGGTGPSAWRQVVVKVPARSAGPLGVRLSFLADSWLIDWVGVSFEGTDQIESQNLPLVALKNVDGGSMSAQHLLEKDKHYFNLYPGETLEAIFSVGATPAHLQRTYFVETEGYLIKWLSPEQLAFSGRDFKPQNEDVFRAARRWLAQNTAMEQLFSAGLASRY